MKRFKICLFAFLSILTLFFFSFCGGIMTAKKLTAKEDIACYAVLYPYEGYIGVYDSPAEYQNGTKPFDIIKTPIQSLPSEDRSALENGILLEDAEKLRQIIEDFDILLFRLP